MSVGFPPFNSSSQTLSNINQASFASNLSQQRISSGSLINSAKDNAAGLAIATRFTSEIDGIAQAKRNVSDAGSFLQTGDGALKSINENVQRIRELTVQAGNGILNSDDRQAIQSEIDSLTEEVFNISENTKFNGISVLNNDSDLDFQVGNEAGQTVTAGASSLTEQLKQLGLDKIDVSSSESAGQALTTLDSVVNTVGSQRSEIGSLQNRLDSIASNLEVQDINANEARSRIEDTDLAAETAKYINANIRREAGIAIQAQTNANAGLVLNLLA